MKDTKQLNGVSIDRIFDAITLLQEAGLDTSSTNMHLTHLLSKEEEEEKDCKHNWVMDGHNAGDPICSKCYARE